MTSPDTFGLVTGSTQIFLFRAALLIPAIFLIVSSERYLPLFPPPSIRAMSHDQASFWNCQ